MRAKKCGTNRALSMSKDIADEIFILVAHTYSIRRISEMRNNDTIIKDMHIRYKDLFIVNEKEIDEYRYGSAQYLYDRMYSDQYKERYAEARRRRLETMLDRTTDINYLHKIAKVDGIINTAGVNLAKLNCEQINRSYALYVAMHQKQENTNCTVEFKL